MKISPESERKKSSRATECGKSSMKIYPDAHENFSVLRYAFKNIRKDVSRIQNFLDFSLESLFSLHKNENRNAYGWLDKNNVKFLNGNTICGEVYAGNSRIVMPALACGRL